MAPLSEEQKWLLTFANDHPPLTGAPWGDGTAMAGRQKNNPPLPPWDANCGVKTLVGGYAAMSAMRDFLERAIREGSVSPKKVGDRGYVYICGWRLNAFRDTSSANDWVTAPWCGGARSKKDQDETVIGLILRLMQAGVEVRVLIWLPPTKSSGAIATVAGMAPHIEDHLYLAKVVRAEDERLRKDVFMDATEPLGIVALDRRVARHPTASHHQKMMVIQGLSFQVAFCGGVDLAYTRRDAPSVTDAPSWQYDHDPPKFLNGDWQSGLGIPDPANLWPLDPSGDVIYNVNANVKPPVHRQPTDLPLDVYGDGSPGCYPDLANQSSQSQHFWHDQHLQLEGPIVTTLEEQFRERWFDSADKIEVVSSDTSVPERLTNAVDLVIFSTPDAFDASNNRIKPLRRATPATAPEGDANSTVQMWRTIPWRASRTSLYLTMGEFTVMAGYAKACTAATELIWIFDQYFWSQWLARLLNLRLKNTSTLRVLIILPPYADQLSTVAHHARQLALDILTDGLSQTSGQYDQIAVYNLWFNNFSINQGIYCHAKTQTYDGNLLVCGSANLNQRSLIGDSEIACAVLDPAVVNVHQRKLWSLLFPETAWPTYPDGSDVDLSVAPPPGLGPGATFYSAFNQAAQHAKRFLIPDPWKKGDAYRLPNAVLREQNPNEEAFKKGRDNLLESTSIALESLEGPIFTGGAPPNDQRAPHLGEIVYRLGNDYRFEHDGEIRWRYRQAPSWISLR